jgi:hypothetical protein
LPLAAAARPPRAAARCARAGGAGPAASDAPSISTDDNRRMDDHLPAPVELRAMDDMLDLRTST